MMPSYAVFVLLCVLCTPAKCDRGDDRWIDPSVWIDMGSGTFISDEIWNDPDLMDLKTCSRVLDDIDDDVKDEDVYMDVINLPYVKGHHSGVGSQALWPKGVIPTQLEPGMTIDEQKRLACAMIFFSQKTCIRFIKKQNKHKDFLLIRKSDDRSGCFSESLGMAGGRQIVNLDQTNSHCWKHGTIVHELMHVVGFFHEQARNDRQKYVAVHWKVIPKALHRQYEKASKLGISQELVGSYDYSSIMHYGRYLPSSLHPTMTAKKQPKKRNNDAMGNRKAPTAMDANKINILYCEQRDCKVSNWIVKTQCSSSCGGGRQTLERTIKRMNTNNGKPCPPLKSQLECNMQPCPKSGDPKILIIGGIDANARSSMELYHPFNPQLNHVINGKMGQARWDHTSALMDDGTVITVGGWDDDRVSFSSCSRFTPSTSTVTQCPSLNTPRRRPASSVLNGVLYVCGGYNNGTHLRTCERLLSNGWQDSVSMNIKRAMFTMVSLNGYLYAIGGDHDDNNHLHSIERLGVTDSHWTFVQSMNNKRTGHSAVMNGKIFVCGGWDGFSKLSSCEQYNPRYDQWLEIGQMHARRSSFQLVYSGKKLFAVGGDASLDETVEMYNSKNNTWTMMQNKLIHKRWGHSALAIP